MLNGGDESSPCKCLSQSDSQNQSNTTPVNSNQNKGLSIYFSPIFAILGHTASGLKKLINFVLDFTVF